MVTAENGLELRTSDFYDGDLMEDDDLDSDNHSESSLSSGENNGRKNVIEYKHLDSLIDKTDTILKSEDIDQQISRKCLKQTNESCTINKKHGKFLPAEKNHRKGLIKCSQCPKLFRFQEKYEIHQKLHNGIRPFSCDQCHKSYKKMDHLNRHKKIHSTEPTVFHCSSEGCDKTFSRVESLQSHLKIKHSGQPEKKEMCDECGKSFVNISYLKTHKLSHLGSDHYPFECGQCAKKFLYKKTMDEHVLRVHTDIRNFVCQICGAKKATKNSLRAHVNTHTRERLYMCKECPKVFASSANLAIHTNCVHKKIKKHKCQFCGYAFSRMLTCKLHERTHTGEKPHACGVCGKTFAQSTARNTHEKIHNK